MATEHNHRKPTQDIRSRIAALHGEPLSEATVLRSMNALGHGLTQKFEKRRVANAQAAEDHAKILISLLHAMHDNKEAIEGINRLRERALHRKKPQLIVPTFPKVEPQIKPGSILSFFAPPYNYEWQTGSGSSSAGTTHGGGEASKAEGTFSIDVNAGSGGGPWGAAGIAIYYRPLSENAFLRFSALVKYSYSWSDDSYGFSAHNDGAMGVYVQSWDLNGQDNRVELDQRPSLWSDGTAGWDGTHSDSGDDLVFSEAQGGVFFPASSSRQYILWIWALDSADATADRIVFIANLGSQASSDLVSYVPFMVVEEFS